MVNQTAVHEIGHIIGLEHSTDERAVMFPSYRPYDPNYSLADDDVRGVRPYPPIVRSQRPPRNKKTKEDSNGPE
ncbi:Macrophage metalloelastase [Toxocara canis]|uniref:Macrophage metalloelastase n=1 Tax=Toxocara canis TaxID=6265 RepID=A0A0B2VUZ9_TOXCA|nr:Macrophage metalloelastase [Toxocara canis]